MPHEIEKKKKEFKAQYMRTLVSKKEAAHELGISCSTLDRMRQDGLIRSKKVRGAVKFSIDELAHFMAS